MECVWWVLTVTALQLLCMFRWFHDEKLGKVRKHGFFHSGLKNYLAKGAHKCLSWLTGMQVPCDSCRWWKDWVGGDQELSGTRMIVTGDSQPGREAHGLSHLCRKKDRPDRDWSYNSVEVASRVIVGVVTFIRLGSGQAMLSPWSLKGVAWVG